MANRLNRYRAYYDKLTRPDRVSTFPIHVFNRAANVHSDIHDRVGDRESCFTSTLLHLTERWGDREIYLVGTVNQSTMLAQRTQKLIEQVKPDTVLVMTDNEWWKHASRLQYVNSQEEFNKYEDDLAKHSEANYFEHYWQSRRWIFLLRLWLYKQTFNWHFRLGFDFPLLRPGLEVSKACEAAEKVGAKLEFLGQELSQSTWKSLYHETRFNLVEYMAKCY